MRSPRVIKWQPLFKQKAVFSTLRNINCFSFSQKELLAFFPFVESEIYYGQIFHASIKVL